MPKLKPCPFCEDDVMIYFLCDNTFDNMPDEAKELYRKYKQYCDGCSKAYDFTCSGADVKACEAKKKDLLDRILDIINTDTLAEGGNTGGNS